MARTKMTRHELKETDEITSGLQIATEFVYRRKNEILVGVGAVVVLGAAIVGWRVYASNRDANAQSQLGAVIQAFNDTTNLKTEKERYEKAIVEAQKVVETYRNHPAGQIAQYYIAMSQRGLGDNQKAEQSLQEVIQRGDEKLKGISQFALASIYKGQGETQKAVDAYKQLLDSGAYPKSAVLFELAKLSELSKQASQAKEYYQRIVSEFADSAFRAEADQALKRLGTPAEPTKDTPKP